MEKHVGFIGLGRMGNPMASRLLAAGYQVTVLDTNADTVNALVAKGATAGESPVDVASKVMTVLLSLPTPTVVEAEVVKLPERWAGVVVKKREG